MFVRNCFQRVCGLFTNESGVTAIEYGLIAALIGVAIVTAATGVGTQLVSTFTSVEAKLKPASPSP